ncbi:MAG: IS200/IS605 family transposase [Anaerolineales bacterium]|nr:IS200/IS605 family transposase [Anaerolineales bacterium]
MPYFRLFYHMVWGTKNREPLIENNFELSLHNVIVAKGKELGAFVYAVGGIEDHLHLVASVPPRIALADYIGQVKGKSSHWINHQLSLPYHFSWQAEYGVVSFGGKQLNMVVKYVKNQRQHHLTGTIIPFLERVESEESRG